MSDEGFSLPKPAVSGTPTSKPLSAPVIPVSPLVPRADASGIPAFYFPSKRVPDENGLDIDELEAIDNLFASRPNRGISSSDEIVDFTTNVLPQQI